MILVSSNKVVKIMLKYDQCGYKGMILFYFCISFSGEETQLWFRRVKRGPKEDIFSLFNFVTPRFLPESN